MRLLRPAAAGLAMTLALVFAISSFFNFWHSLICGCAFGLFYTTTSGNAIESVHQVIISKGQITSFGHDDMVRDGQVYYLAGLHQAGIDIQIRFGRLQVTASVMSCIK